MYKGDISNDMPKRVLIAEDLVIIKQPRIEKIFGLIPRVRYDIVYDRIFLNKLYQYTVNQGISLELVSFENDYNELQEIYNELDRNGVNPFRGFSYYKSPKTLVSDLPHRPEVLGVIDPVHQLMYGRWGMDL